MRNGKNKKQKTIRSAIRKSYPILFLALIFGIAGYAVTVKANYYIKLSFDNVLSEARSLEVLKTNSLQMLCFVLIAIVLMLIASYLKSLYSQQAMTYAKNFYLTKLFSKNVSEFNKDNTAKYFSNLTNDMQKVEQKYILAIHEIVYNFFNLLISIAVLLYVNYMILLLALGIGVVFLILVGVLSIPIKKHEAKISEVKGFYTVYVKEIVSAYQVIKTNNLENKGKEDFFHKSKTVEDTEYRLGKFIAYLSLALGFVLAVLLLGTIAFGIYLIYIKVMTVGSLIFAMTLFGNILNPIGAISGEIEELVAVKPVFKAINDNLKAEDNSCEKIELNSFEEKIEFNNVRFAYDTVDILSGVNYEFEKGKKYLITGPSGGGKTTMLKLLRKYFNPNEGEILIDGKDLKEITALSYFKNIANIEQQVFLFEDTLYNNITLYKNYSDEEVQEAIEKSGLSHFVENLDEGLDYKITDNGKNISGGEKARIAIARGLITKTKLIFLDEAFASLDKDTASQIERTLLDLDDLTLINVSHVVFEENQKDYNAVLTVKPPQSGGVQTA